MQRIRWIWALAVVLTVLMGVVDAAQAQVLAMGDAINKAGRQRMLTQRMIKAYALAGMKLGDDAEHELHAAATLYDAQLTELTAFAANAEERAQIDRITHLWSDLRERLSGGPERTRAGDLNDLAEQLLGESHQLVLLLEKRSGTVAGKLVNIAGRQRMLSQRIAKIYLLQTWGVEQDHLATQYRSAVEQFSDALKTLQRADINTPEVDAALADVAKNWGVFKISDFSKKYNTRVPWLVTRSMNRILGQMNEITAMYAGLY